MEHGGNGWHALLVYVLLLYEYIVYLLVMVVRLALRTNELPGMLAGTHTCRDKPRRHEKTSIAKITPALSAFCVTYQALSLIHARPDDPVFVLLASVITRALFGAGMNAILGGK